MPPEDKSKNKVVTTYADDMAGVIESSEGGLIKKIIRQEEASEIEKKNFSPESRQNKFFIFASLLLIILTVAVLVFLIMSRDEIGTVDVDMQLTPIIFNDKTTFIEVTGLAKDKLVASVLNQISLSDVKAGGVEGIYLAENKTTIGLSRFLELIQASLTKDKIIFFEENFLLGAINHNTRDLFILLQVRSFSDVFNEMRAWEGRMFYDLHDFFKVPIDTSTNYLLTKNFEDGIVQNKNARVLHNNAGGIVLMYVFLDDTSIIITNNENTTREIMLRLAGSRIKK